MQDDLLNLYNVGFPDQWTTTKFEKSIAQGFYTEFFGSEPGLIVNWTWHGQGWDGTGISGNAGLPTKEQSIIATLEQTPEIQNVLIYNFTDEFGVGGMPALDKIYSLANTVMVGNVHPWLPRTQYFPYWYLMSKMFFNVTIEPRFDQCEHVYLCYNRKPHGHRIRMLELFYKHKLLDKGVFTMGYDTDNARRLPADFVEIQEKGYLTFDGNSADVDTSTNKMSADNPQYKIVADAFTLGNIDIWQKSFLNIVNETECNIPWQATPFVTEKTFKPIAGKRPFIINGDQGINDLVKQMGFETFEDMVTLDSLTDFIKETTPDQCLMLYKKYEDKIEHNYHHFHNYINQLKDQYSFLDSCLNP